MSTTATSNPRHSRASLPPGLDYDSLAENWRKAIIADGVQIQGPPQYGA